MDLGNKKLKCTGEQPFCARCVKKGINCEYALQKPMGRPKKRKLDYENADRTGNDSNEEDLPSQLVSNIEQEDDGRWFNGGGFGTPMVVPLVDDHDYWPSLEEANAANERRNYHATSAREVPSSLERYVCDCRDSIGLQC